MVDESPYFLPNVCNIAVITEIYTMSTFLVPRKLQKLHLKFFFFEDERKKRAILYQKKTPCFSPVKIPVKRSAAKNFWPILTGSVPVHGRNR